jgi:hypothetical protein
LESNVSPEAIDENDLTVLDRSLHLGDVVKRRSEDVMSGVITQARMKLTLEQTFTGQKVENVDSSDVKDAAEFMPGITLSTHLN